MFGLLMLPILDRLLYRLSLQYQYSSLTITAALHCKFYCVGLSSVCFIRVVTCLRMHFLLVPLLYESR